MRIEVGRYRYEPVEERICDFCDTNSVKDEEHFIFECFAYATERNKLFNGIEYNGSNSNMDKLSFLFENHTYKIVHFIKNAYERRKHLLYKE